MINGGIDPRNQEFAGVDTKAVLLVENLLQFWPTLGRLEIGAGMALEPAIQANRMLPRNRGRNSTPNAEAGGLSSKIGLSPLFLASFAQLVSRLWLALPASATHAGCSGLVSQFSFRGYAVFTANGTELLARQSRTVAIAAKPTVAPAAVLLLFGGFGLCVVPFSAILTHGQIR